MTDRELLKLAAKAADYIFTEKLTESAQGKRKGPFISHRQRWKQWDPLTDDGDALRLAVKLEISLPTRLGDQCYARHDLCGVVKEVSSDYMAATRRAIVRAAAEIGKAMQ